MRAFLPKHQRPVAANRAVPRLKKRKPEEPLEAHHVLVDLAPLLFVAAEQSVEFEGEGWRRASELYLTPAVAVMFWPRHHPKAAAKKKAAPAKSDPAY